MKQARLDRATLRGIELEYEVWGTGEEPVVLVHHGVGVDWFRPLLEEPSLTDNFRVLSYHRVGYGGAAARRFRSISSRRLCIVAR